MLDLFTKHTPKNVMFKRIENMWDIIQTLPEIYTVSSESRVLALRNGKRYCNLCYTTALGNVNVAIEKQYTYDKHGTKCFEGYRVVYSNLRGRRPLYGLSICAEFGGWLMDSYLNDVFSLDVTSNSLDVHPQLRTGELLAKDIDLAILEAEQILVPLQEQKVFHDKQVKSLMDGV